MVFGQEGAEGARASLLGGGNSVESEGDRVVFVEDVVSTGASLLRAVDRVLELGAVAVAAVTLLDRSQAAGRRFAARGIRYLPLLTSVDIGIDPLPEEAATAEA